MDAVDKTATPEPKHTTNQSRPNEWILLVGQNIQAHTDQMVPTWVCVLHHVRLKDIGLCEIRNGKMCLETSRRTQEKKLLEKYSSL